MTRISPKAAHQLRQHITAAKGALEIVQEKLDEGDAKAVTKFMKLALSEIEAMTKYIAKNIVEGEHGESK